MRTPRYQHLMQLLRGWKTAPPLSEVANTSAKTAATYVKKAQRKADKRLREAGDDIEQLHRSAQGDEAGCDTPPNSSSLPTTR